MAIAFRRYEDTDFDAIARFNRRMDEGGSPHRLYYEDLTKNPTADLDIRAINDSLYVASDGTELRGGSWLREQYFWVEGERHRVGWMKYAIAESQVDPRFSAIPLVMVRGLVRQQSRLMALGMGGHDAPFAQLLDAVGWKSSTVPFLFRILRPYRVLRGLSYLRRRPWMRRAMDLAAWSGTGWLAHGLYGLPAVLVARRGVDVTVEPNFGPWADQIWERCRDRYHALAVRDARALSFRHPSSAEGIERLRVRRDGSDLGWVCVRRSSGGDLAAYFGDLNVGLIVDMLGDPADAPALLGAAVRYLDRQGTDIVVTNMTHESWIAAARRLRFLEGPSNMAFYRAPETDRLLSRDGVLAPGCHITRSDD